jgi:large subunit ribosomal protein L31
LPETASIGYDFVLRRRPETLQVLPRTAMGSDMKAGIHPNYVTVKVHCACGANWETKSTKGQELRLEICSNCHPFFTGKHKLMDTAGRVERFNRKFGKKTPAAQA